MSKGMTMPEDRQTKRHGGNIYSVWNETKQRRVYRYQKKWFNPELAETAWKPLAGSIGTRDLIVVLCVIPTDGRPHDPVRVQDVQWDGEPSGHWEGDTLVIESVGFTNESWLGWPGYFHTFDMRVVETVRREGNTLIWQATVHDPDVLTEPWEMEPVRKQLNTDPLARLVEDPPCDEQDMEHMATRERG